MPKKKKIARSKLSHDDAPATVGLVNRVRDELKAEIRGSMQEVLARMDEKIGQTSARIDEKVGQTNARIDGTNERVDQVLLRLDETNAIARQALSKAEKSEAMAHRTLALMEEQRGESRIVLDAIKSFIERQDRFEYELGEVKQTVLLLATRSH